LIVQHPGQCRRGSPINASAQVVVETRTLELAAHKISDSQGLRKVRITKRVAISSSAPIHATAVSLNMPRLCSTVSAKATSMLLSD